MKTSVVHQHVHAADLLDGGFPGFGIGDFEGDELGTACGALHECCGTFTPLTHAEVDDGFRLVGEEKLGDGEAEGSVGSGDEDVSRHGKVVFKPSAGRGKQWLLPRFPTVTLQAWRQMPRDLFQHLAPPNFLQCSLLSFVARPVSNLSGAAHLGCHVMPSLEDSIPILRAPTWTHGIREPAVSDGTGGSESAPAPPGALSLFGGPLAYAPRIFETS